MRWFSTERKGILAPLVVRHETLTVFLVNLCIMTLELVAGRMVAPYVGVSLYTWTGVIGVVLLGMSLGNLYGGKAADLNPSRALVGYLLLGAGVVSLTTIFLIQLLGAAIAVPGIPYILQVFLMTSIFLIPSFLLGAVSPVIVKLSVKDLQTTGGVVGRIYAAAALGSIVGTYMTGFILISKIGVRAIVVLVTILLLLVAAGYVDVARLLRREGRRGRWLVVLLASGAALALVDSRQACFRESNYYCIKVIQEEGSPLKRMALDKLVHSISHTEDPTHIEYDYEKLVAVIYESFSQPPVSLFLGGGGYTLPRYFISVYGEPEITVVEIDPQVSRVAFSEFAMPRESSVKTVNEDARIFLTHLDPQIRYDIIFGDAFSDFSIPYHLTTREFSQRIADHLEDDGVYVANVIDTLSPGLFLRSYVRTLRQVFSHVVVFEPGEGSAEPEGRYTYVVVAGRRAVDVHRLREVAERLGYGEEIIRSFTPQELDGLLASQEEPIVLTDDFVPADNLIAPVYVRSTPSFLTAFPELGKLVRSWVPWIARL